MMHDEIEHTEHRRAPADRREPVAWAGVSSAVPDAATDVAPERESRR